MSRHGCLFLLGALCAVLTTDASAAAAPPRLEGSFVMHVVVTEEQGLGDRRPGSKFDREVRIKRLSAHRARMGVETVRGDIEWQGITLKHGWWQGGRRIRRSCLVGPGTNSGDATFRFRVTRSVTRDGRRLASRFRGTFHGSYTGCGTGRGSETWKYHAIRTDLPPKPARPNADFVFEPEAPSMTGGANTVFFTDTSDDDADGGEIVSWQWDFGDPASGAANASPKRDPSHAFSAAGNYRVTLTVTDDRGLRSTTSDVLTVAP